MKSKLLIFMVFMVLLTGCLFTKGTPDEEPNPTQSVPTATSEILPTKTLQPTDTPKPTNTPQPSSTPSPLSVLVEITLFHDHNANEIEDPGEPGISDALVEAGDQSCRTDDGGHCVLGYFSSGSISIKIDSTSSPVTNLAFIYAGGKVYTSDLGLPFEIETDTSATIAVGQGPFPIPIANESLDKIANGFGVQINSDGTYYHHAGIDIGIQGDGPQPIFAPISGEARPDPSGTWGDCNHVTIWYKDSGMFVGVGMGHLTEVVVEPDAVVAKGEIIGYIDPTLYGAGQFLYCTSVPHIHMNIWGNIPGEVWPHEDSDLPWEPLPEGEWGWLNPENYLPSSGNPVPMFVDLQQAENYREK